jgi:putative FmdB family regulatory protein
MNPYTKRAMRNSAIDRAATRKSIRADIEKNKEIGRIMTGEFKAAREFFKESQMAPEYEYACSVCKHTEQKFHSMIISPVYKCPKCDVEMHRVIYPVAGVVKDTQNPCTNRKTK